MLICLYLLDGNVLTTPYLLCLLYVSFVAFCCALCIFEKLGRLYICFDMHFSWKQGEEFHIPWFMHCQQGGEFWGTYMQGGEVSCVGEILWEIGMHLWDVACEEKNWEEEVAFAQGEFAYVQGELLWFAWVLCFVVCSLWALFCLGCVEPLPLS